MNRDRIHRDSVRRADGPIGIGISTGGNTLGTSGTVDAGTAVFAGIGGITLSQSSGPGQALTITISGAAESGVGIAISNTSLSNGFVLFSNSPTVTFGLNGSTVTASAAQGTTGELAVSAVGGSVNSGTVVFSNSPTVTFGLNGSTVTASAAQGTTGELAVSAAGNSVNVGTVVWSNSNGVSFGMNGSTVTAQHNAVTDLAINDASGAQANAGQRRLAFSNTNGFSFGKSVNGVTWFVTLSDIRRASFYETPPGDQGAVSAEVTRLLFQRIQIPMLISATQANFFMAISNSSSAGATDAISFGVYTMNETGTATTASLVSSGTRSWMYNSTSGGNSYTDASGTRMRSIAIGTWNLTPGDYLFALQFRATTALTSQSMSFLGGHTASILAYENGAASTAAYFNHGKLSVSTAAFPNTVAASDIKGANFDAAHWFPYFQLFGT